MIFLAKRFDVLAKNLRKVYIRLNMTDVALLLFRMSSKVIYYSWLLSGLVISWLRFVQTTQNLNSEFCMGVVGVLPRVHSLLILRSADLTYVRPLFEMVDGPLLAGKLDPSSSSFALLCLHCEYPLVDPRQVSCGDRVCADCYGRLRGRFVGSPTLLRFFPSVLRMPNCAPAVNAMSFELPGRLNFADLIVVSFHTAGSSFAKSAGKKSPWMWMWVEARKLQLAPVPEPSLRFFLSVSETKRLNTS